MNVEGIPSNTTGAMLPSSSLIDDVVTNSSSPSQLAEEFFSPDVVTAMTLNEWNKHYTKLQVDAIAIAPVISGSISIIGSSLVVYMIYKRGNFKKLYHRLMLPLSLFDILFSLGALLGPISVPKEVGTRWSMGTWATCKLTGFLIQLNFTVTCYNVSLLAFFLLTTRYKWTEYQISKRLELPMHIISTCLPISSCILGLVFDLYSPVPGGCRRCYMAVYPPNCNSLGQECVRGSVLLNTLFVGIPGSIVLCFYICAVVVLNWTIRQRIRQSRTFSQSSQFNNLNSTMSIAHQSMLYAILFVNSYVWSFAAYVSGVLNLSRTNGYAQPPFGLIILAETFWPMQGIFNFIIFSRPRFLRILRHLKQEQHFNSRHQGQDSFSSTNSTSITSIVVFFHAMKETVTGEQDMNSFDGSSGRRRSSMNLYHHNMHSTKTTANSPVKDKSLTARAISSNHPEEHLQQQDQQPQYDQRDILNAQEEKPELGLKEHGRDNESIEDQE